MKLIQQSFEIIAMTRTPAKLIEKAGRTCYKSEDKITDDSAAKFIKMLLNRGHESVLEHASATARIITNRGVTHELVRHRLASFSQESTRYVNYGCTDHIEFIQPIWYGQLMPDAGLARLTFRQSCAQSEKAYKKLLGLDWRPEQAREVLPNALKTEIVVTANMREWRHIMKLRRSPAAHPQMRSLMNMGFEQFMDRCPELFEDLTKEAA